MSNFRSREIPLSRKKKKTRPAAKPAVRHFLLQRMNEMFILIVSGAALFLLLALVTYHSKDPSWSNLVDATPVRNSAGRAGAWIADFLFYLCGYTAFLISFLLMYWAWMRFQQRNEALDDTKAGYGMVINIFRFIGFLLAIIAACGSISLQTQVVGRHHSFLPGGIIGNAMAGAFLKVFNFPGSCLMLLFLFLLGFTLFSNCSWFKVLEGLGNLVVNTGKNIGEQFGKISFRRPVAKPVVRKEHEIVEIIPQVKSIAPAVTVVPAKVMLKKPTPAPNQDAEEFSKDMRRAPRYSKSDVLPDLLLLDSYENKKTQRLSEQDLQDLSRQVEIHLADFGVSVQVVDVHPGPVVTRFELQLAAGTKVSKISNLSKDLARSLSVVSVRVVEVIPGKSVIGLELPNKDREVVGLQEVLASKAYASSRSPLSLALGKDIGGHPVVVDLAKMPHLLVAGTTGAGKSVSLNAMLLSLLYKATPQQLRMIMIDPKMLELSVYEGIPHLLTPVVTDMRDAASALRWCVVEMERRYRLMSALGVRNIAGYNAKVLEAAEKGAPLLDPLPRADDEEQKALQTLPQIVVLADEFADMMVVVGKKVETLIARLAQKARAAGVHLILATQRPSVDVITGLIKANIPTRIAFQVSSKIDSRTILDQSGAEQLLGNGDMLYLAPGTGVPMRVHGAYVSDDEVHRVVADLKQKGKPDYVEDIIRDNFGTEDSGGTEGSLTEFNQNADAEQDPLYDEAVEMVIKARKVSVSSVQRRFKIGYNRAARIVEAMENAGVVSKMETNGAREVLVAAIE